MTKDISNDSPSRRAFLEKLSYVAPAILTLQARPAFAQQGSGVRTAYISDSMRQGEAFQRQWRLDHPE